MNPAVTAVVADPAAPFGWARREVAAPEPAPSQALVAVRHVSLNHGDRRYATLVPAGTVLGWDATGTVVRAAADGSGPAAGSEVLAFGAGAWSQLAAFAVEDIAPLPAGADPAAHAALPLAGFTALRALRGAGSLLGRRVLVTGASGGVGRFAVQLAALGGAEVIASVGAAARGAGLERLGASAVAVGLDGVDGPLDVVLDTVGGPLLAGAYALLAPGGSLLSVGWSSGEPATLEPYATFGDDRAIRSFADARAVGGDLALLARLAASGRLSIEVGWRGSWEQLDEAAAALAAREIAGKAVLDVDPLPGGGAYAGTGAGAGAGAGASAGAGAGSTGAAR
ncbi:zinc-binding dehydrogenase [Conexibacter stalactiti]|uniref:Zinc-binding dehydrogenase n=1 Tax=Conexibacter stalactiti TaxID=1940611 RepID=A0ABU4HU72_9ACTN|nr:zinc-binding dehydrogenase [Conexibacter stalactiti]MDW5596843.1 zinc-binding dehydrogenase [Conexibacter stalactiti]MEC5037485.1 zinc-binding dehydrogenase [Conexibacter stalactiti]